MLQFVQKNVFSNNGISADLVAVLGASGETNVKEAINSCKNRTEIEELFRWATSAKFIKIDFKRNEFNSPNKVPYQSMENALKQLKYFTVDSEFLKDDATKRNKLIILLQSVTFVEADALYNLVSGNYDISAVKNHLYPSKKKKEPVLLQSIVEGPILENLVTEEEPPPDQQAQ